MNLCARIYDTMEKLIAVPSISGTDGEKEMSKVLYELLLDIPYFNDNRENCGSRKIEGDPLDRELVWAILKGRMDSKDTFILTGHYDVVDVEEYGHLSNIAFDMEACTNRISELKLDEDAMADQASGKWVFGRGTADIKSGIASYIEIVREMSQERNFKGNLLLILVPGEESNSEGMVDAIPFLVKLQEQKEYNYVGAVVCECSIPQNENEDFKRLYVGSVGKVMPMFFCTGKETHAGEPFKGLNPNMLISEINKQMELNPDFCDKVNGKTSPPPMALKQMDLKKLYSVKSPLYAAAYYNVLTLDRPEEKLQRELFELSIKAFNNVLEDINKKEEAYSLLSGKTILHNEFQPVVMEYSELLSNVTASCTDFNNILKVKIKAWKNEKLDNQTIAINIVKETYEKYENKRPMIIISFIPPYYPHVHLDSDNSADCKFMGVVDKTINYAKEAYDVKLVKEDYFMGISDLSYTGMGGNNNIHSFADNIVGYEINYDLHLNYLSRLHIPGIVFAGEGKDIHKYSERLNVPYSLNIVPELYKYLIYSMLGV